MTYPSEADWQKHSHGEISGLTADISTALQDELTRAAAANRQTKIQALCALVRQAQTAQPVYRRMMPRSMLILSLVTAVFIPGVLAAGFGVLAVLGAPAGERLVMLLMPVLGAVAIALGVWLLKRKPKLSLTIRPDGLELPGQPAVLAWSAISDLRLVNNSGNLDVYLDLDRQAPAPASGLPFYCRYVKDKHQLIIVLIVADGKQLEQVRGTIVNYHRAFHAKAELQRMGVALEQDKPGQPVIH